MRWGMAFIGGMIIIIVGLFHVMALMNLYPLYITSPLLFLSIYATIAVVYKKKTFRGFTD